MTRIKTWFYYALGLLSAIPPYRLTVPLVTRIMGGDTISSGDPRLVPFMLGAYRGFVAIAYVLAHLGLLRNPARAAALRNRMQQDGQGLFIEILERTGSSWRAPPQERGED